MSLSSKSLVVGLVAGLVVGLLLGYAVTLQTENVAGLKQQITQLEGQANSLQTQISEKENEITNLKNNVTDLQSQITTLQNQLDEKNGEIQTLQTQIISKNNQISNLQTQIAELQDQIEELEELIPPYVRGDWNLIATFVGSSDMITDYFYVAGTEMRINWTWSSSSQYGYFTIWLYREGLSYSTESFLDLGETGTTFVHNIEPSNYYLDLSVANLDQWTVTIEVYILE